MEGFGCGGFGVELKAERAGQALVVVAVVGVLVPEILQGWGRGGGGAGVGSPLAARLARRASIPPPALDHLPSSPVRAVLDRRGCAGAALRCPARGTVADAEATLHLVHSWLLEVPPSPASVFQAHTTAGPSRSYAVEFQAEVDKIAYNY